MLLLTVTRSGRPVPDVGRAGTTFDAGRFRIQVVTDGFLSRCEPTADGFELVESPMTGIAGAVVPDAYRSITIRFDRRDARLTLGKTLFGGRPLYHRLGPNGEFFASTHVGMLGAAGVALVEDPGVLPEYLVYRLVMPPRTLFRDVLDLPPGSSLDVALGGTDCVLGAVRPYDPPPPMETRSVADVAERVLARVRDGLHALAPVRGRVSVLLSGGIDSSILYQEARRALRVEDSYSTEYPFEDPGTNVEREYALSAAREFGSRHTHFQIDVPRYLRGLVEAIAAAEMPVHHLQSVLLHALFREGIPADRDVVLVGVGAGGSFGNFRNFLYRRRRLLFRLASRRPLRAAVEWASRVTGKGGDIVRDLGLASTAGTLSSTQDPLWGWHAYGDPAFVCRTLGVTPEDVIRGPLRSMEGMASRPLEDVWSLYSLLGDEAITQCVWSKIGEVAGRRIVFPYYDDALLAFLFSVSWETKLSRPENAVRREMARQAAVPAFIRNRPKSGFGIVKPGWADRGGVFERLVPLAAEALGEEPLRRAQEAPGSGPMLFWSLLNYGIWKRLCVDRRDPVDLLAELAEPAR